MWPLRSLFSLACLALKVLNQGRREANRARMPGLESSMSVVRHQMMIVVKITQVTAILRRMIIEVNILVLGGG